MKTSVIIPTYNEKDVLEDCIESLGAQSQEDFEIIVVDDGSSDGTSAILKNLRSTIGNFKFLEQKHSGAGPARNLGAKTASGEILVFVDADMTFDKDFLKNLVYPIESGETKGTFSKEEFVGNWDNVWSRCWGINEGWEEKRRHPKNYPDRQPVFRAILKKEFDRIGGFSLGGYNDDWSLYKKLGYEADNAKDAIFYHKNPDSLSGVFSQARWVGKRRYKFGFVGFLFALARASLPVSIVVGLWKAVRSFNFYFPIFKIIYDLGASAGIIEFATTGKGYK